MKFFNIDQHISVIADIKHIFEKLGHTVNDWCLSGHAYVFNRRQSDVPLLSGDNWCTIANNHLWDKFYDQYKKTFDEYDGFIVTYPPMFAYLWEKFKKPIILHIPIRFDYGMYKNAANIAKFIDYLKDENVIISANSKYDQKYLEVFSDIKCKHISSLCEYTGVKYTGNKDQLLYYATKRIPEMPKNIVRREDTLQAGYAWADVAAFKGIVHIPYQISTMSLFEQYTECIPIFLPTKDFMMKLYVEDKVLEHYSNFKLGRNDPGSVAPYNYTYDPNQFDDLESVRHWLDFADYYDTELMPHITYFDSFEDLDRLVKTVDFKGISNKMMIANINRQRIVYGKWEETLKEVSVRCG